MTAAIVKKTVGTCPECGRSLKYREILAAGPFACPVCQAQLQAPDSYGRWIGLGSLLLPVAILGAFGFRGLHLLYAVLLSFLPIDWLALRLVKYVMPPKIEIYLPRETTLRLRSGPRA